MVFHSWQSLETCPLHKTDLHKGQLKIIYGLQVGKVAQQINLKRKATVKLFPQANSLGFGSCLAPSDRDFDYQPVKFCPQCRQAEYAWENQHWDAPLIKKFSGRFIAAVVS